MAASRSAPTIVPVTADWRRPSGRPMWGDIEYRLTVTLPDRKIVFEVRGTEG